MKIAVIVSEFPKTSETFILHQITGLLDLGHDVQIFARSHPDEPTVHPDIERYRIMDRVHYPSVPADRREKYLNACAWICRNINRDPVPIINSINLLKFGKRARSLQLFYLALPFYGYDFDIFHCHFGPNGAKLLPLKDIGFRGAFVTSFHGYDVHSYTRVHGKEVYEDLFAAGDLFTCNTEYTKSQAAALGCDEERIRILPVGLDLEKYPYRERNYPEEGRVRILTVGRLVEKKGHEFMLRALREVLRERDDVEYIIVGNGPLEEHLKGLVEAWELTDHVMFLTSVSDDELLKLYRECHLFALTSVTAPNGDKEGQALVLQEAQATGMPVISTFHNGIPEGVLHERSGFLVQEWDVGALRDTLLYLIGHPEQWADMGKTGREFVAQKYDILKLNRDLVAIYATAIDGRKG